MITREFDTIAAISTPLGEGAIGIVRLSGTDSFAIAQKIFKGKDLSKVASHTLNYGHIIDPLTGKVMDEEDLYSRGYYRDQHPRRDCRDQ